MNVRKKILPVICLMSAYIHWIKPRLLSTSASKSGKSLLLHLCARSRFLIPMIVFTAFWIFDAQMQIEATVSLTLSRNVRITLGPDVAQAELDDDNNDPGNDSDETYSVDSFSDDYSSTSDLSMLALDDLESALQEFVQSDTIQRISNGNANNDS
ncbi:uncharacterized protein LOC126904312 isoform X2 [Daktulosphaira vitifoliae]|nr:uncharacterized protein LOC126904312 isoform X2 [Daktulosphaira vitifoliae]XP_050539242.1 uncharacterized protein LOC126904312 isoform X2 [Daktulosphaira vitifoliae]XP_050539243.1 uncharacterized protein LOC126904312 isoform X2 [Daktulosphaira vitifoliae]